MNDYPTIKEVLSNLDGVDLNDYAIDMEDLIKYMEVVNGEMLIDLNKYRAGNKAAGKRVRKYTLIAAKLGKKFRKESIK